ncbi:MAG TPA: HDOD domain-containing protein [Verrucomicrobiae bacterium]|nr:HDOD domain-containing protein [Verrucomicrobiae bacterium]
MTPVAANLSTPREATAADPTPVSAAEIDSEASTETKTATPAREFLDRLGMIDRMLPIAEVNQEIRLEHPNFENLYRGIEASPDLLKRFLKFANSSWFNSRIQVDSPLMAFSRFGTEGFYRLVLATFLQENVGELSTKFKIWPHLEWSGRAGEMVAQQLAPNYSDETFAAGLFHDAMIAPMERELQDYQYFLECALQVDPVVTGLENSCHGFDHTQAAAELARSLNFDQSVVDAIAAHHHESLSTVPAGDSRTVLSLLLCTKRALSVSRGQKKNAFETATEKALLREIAAALNVSSGRVVNAIADVVDLLHVPATA